MRPEWLLALSLGWLPGVVWAGCPAPPSTPNQLVEAADEGLAAFAQMDAASVVTHYQHVQAGIPCLDVVVAPEQAARMHLLEGLAGFLEKRDDAATAFASAKAADPRVSLPEGMVPDGHVVQQSFADADPASAPTGIVVAPPGATVWIDGTRAQTDPPTRAQGRPALIQLTNSAGDVRWSGYLLTGDRNPDWRSVELEPAAEPSPPVEPVGPKPTPLPEPPPEPAKRSNALAVALTVAAVGGAGTAMAFGTASGRAHAAFDDPSLTDAQALRDTADAANRYGRISQGSAVAATLLGAGAVVAWTF